MTTNELLWFALFSACCIILIQWRVNRRERRKNQSMVQTGLRAMRERDDACDSIERLSAAYQRLLNDHDRLEASLNHFIPTRETPANPEGYRVRETLTPNGIQTERDVPFPAGWPIMKPLPTRDSKGRFTEHDS